MKIGVWVAGAGLALAAWNRLTVARLTPGVAVLDTVTVCVPARNEAQRLPALLADLRAQVGVSRLRVLVLDDDSTDGTYDAALDAIGDDPRFEVHRGAAAVPDGCTGKAAACAQLAELAGDATTLVFLDADVRLTPHALAAAVTQLRRSGVSLLSPWPTQLSGSVSERLVQPLLCWSWASTMPVRLANSSLRPSLAVACGQFLVVEGFAYRQVGGHAAVAAAATDDLALARLLRHNGFRTAVVSAAGMASCRMYAGSAQVDAGYTRWLWTTPLLSVLLAVLYLLPTAYPAAVLSRLLARSIEAEKLSGADVVDALAHPVSMGAFTRLQVLSRYRRRRGTLEWKGRRLPPS